MAHFINSDELKLIAALRPFTSPRGQRLIDTFLNLVNRPENLDANGLINATEVKKQVNQILNQQLEDILTLFVIFSLLGNSGWTSLPNRAVN